MRTTASREVRRFIADLIEMAGGARSVALDLEKLGYVGRDRLHREQLVRMWGTGAYMPSSDLLFALARYYELSLDEYAFGEPEEHGPGQAVPGLQQRRAQLRKALRHALWELVDADEAQEAQPPVEWVGSGVRGCAAEDDGEKPGITQ